MTPFQRARARLWRIRGWLIGLPLVATALALVAQPLGPVGRLETLLYDLRITTFSPPPQRSPDVVIVAVDDATVQGIRSNPSYVRNFSNWPYVHSLWARVIDHLAADGARAVVLDFEMSERNSDAGQDALLRQVLAGLRIPVAVGVAVNVPSEAGQKLPPVDPRNARPGPTAARKTTPPASADDPFGGPDETASANPEDVSAALAFPIRTDGLELRDLAVDLPGAPHTPRYPVPPIPALIGVTSAFGLVLPEADGDGTLRRTRFAYTDGVNRYVTLSVAIAADLLGADKVEIRPGMLRIGERTYAIDPDGSAGIDFGGPLHGRFDTRQLITVLDDSVRRERGEPTLLPPGFFRDKVVFLAGFAVGTYDQKATPFSAEEVGVAKPAAELDAFLHGRFIVRAPFWATIALALLASFLSALLVLGARRVWVETLWPILAPPLLFLATGPLLASGKVHLSLVVPALAATLTNLAAVAVNHLIADRERARVKAMFSRYVDPHVVDQLVEQAELPRLDGETLEITAFFSDIKGFSTFSERFRDDPRGLVALLNTYLTRVSAALLRHGACLDKYIGDAVVSIFGAPLKFADHAERACAAALDVQREIQALRVEYRDRGLPDLATRIGLNTAVMFVGNFGSEQLFNYTAMGDGMNLASRLEGANKPYGSRIMIGPRTQALVGHAFETRELDRVRVAGKTEAVAVHELVGRRGEVPEAKLGVLALYAEALALWRAGRFMDASGVAARAVALDPEDGPSRALEARARAHAASPPADFDGVVNLDK
jgi:adenylate cyclase